MNRPSRILLTLAAATGALGCGGVAIAAVAVPTATATPSSGALPRPAQTALATKPELKALQGESAALELALGKVNREISNAKRLKKAPRHLVAPPVKPTEIHDQPVSSTTTYPAAGSAAGWASPAATNQQYVPPVPTATYAPPAVQPSNPPVTQPVAPPVVAPTPAPVTPPPTHTSTGASGSTQPEPEGHDD